jgi:hypothetical protein
VPEEVAASKHVGIPPRQAPPGEAQGDLGSSEVAEDADRSSSTGQAQRTARRRTIRINESVKERRGLDHGPRK